MTLPQTPEILWGELFTAVQLGAVFPDSKTFVDCTPRSDPSTILNAYYHYVTKEYPAFDLKTFVETHFDAPKPYVDTFVDSEQHEPRPTATDHIKALWKVLMRQPDSTSEFSTLLPLPFAYIVPGGRFGEIYYWDSYFTMLGLKADGEVQTIRDMVANFAYLIEKIGHIPNGNRSYFLSRSQPPFFVLMVRLLAEIDGEMVLERYKNALLKEYAFWMEGTEILSENKVAHRRVVGLADGFIWNRFWDDSNTPRAEAYHEDIEIAHQTDRDPVDVYRHLKAGAESGWDFSSRWLRDPQRLETIHTTDILPIDLQALIYELEMTLSMASSDAAEKAHFAQKASARKAAFDLFWHEGFFHDYDWAQQKHTAVKSLAGLFPLFCGIATDEQAQCVAQVVADSFLKAGGVITTLETTAQQWDAPNGWAPLQWITVQGLRRYGFHDLANTIQQRWLSLNDKVFDATGKMMEKYNVVDTSLLAGGGEYPNQDGFGWTNGVYRAMKSDEKST